MTPEFQRSVATSVPCSSATPEPRRSAAESVPHVSSALEFQGSAVSVLGSSEKQELKEDLARDYWIKVWDECSSGDSLFEVQRDDERIARISKSTEKHARCLCGGRTV